MKQRYSLSFQQREASISNLVPKPGFTCSALGASVAFYILPWSGPEQVVLMSRRASSLGALFCQKVCRSGGGGLVSDAGLLSHPLATSSWQFLRIKG